MSTILFALKTIHSNKPTVEEISSRVFGSSLHPLKTIQLEYRTTPNGLEYGMCHFTLTDYYNKNVENVPSVEKMPRIGGLMVGKFQDEVTDAVAFHNFLTVDSAHIHEEFDIFKISEMLTDFHATVSDISNIRSMVLSQEPRTDIIEVCGNIVFTTKIAEPMSAELMEYLFDNFDSLDVDSIKEIPVDRFANAAVYTFSFKEYVVEGFRFDDILNTINSFEEVSSVIRFNSDGPLNIWATPDSQKIDCLIAINAMDKARVDTLNLKG